MDRRYLTHAVAHDAFASGKMAFVSGPRQVGKTTLGKSVLRDSCNYFTWDRCYGIAIAKNRTFNFPGFNEFFDEHFLIKLEGQV